VEGLLGAAEEAGDAGGAGGEQAAETVGAAAVGAMGHHAGLTGRLEGQSAEAAGRLLF
jgi:hypothetical protein